MQTETSMEHFLAIERKARRPATLRLIGQSHILLDNDGSGEPLRARCAAQLAAGPEPLTAAEMQAARYGITDLLDDLAGSHDDNERLLIAVNLWRATADLLLTGHGHWTGSGKWLHRELCSLDRETSTDYSQTLAHGVRSVALGAIEPMADIVTQALNAFGGRLFDGFRAEGPS
ncbi:nucleotidyltransferase domain-containing protein [Nocardia nova]|uniref:nucleotidyltransferase domain-containing protein n=1 Tax=Nocardia nova TaxID=37330 RepID=UPI0012E95B54|nr:nucleotidyltransferase domain-containing protein [Nocardia nova]